MLLVYLSCEAAGIVVCGWVWLAHRHDRDKFLEANFRLQCWWANTQFRAGLKLYGVTLDIEGERDLLPAPLVLLVRHVSVFDNLIPAVLLSQRHGIRLRWVLNRSLLRDPCLDLVGNRLPNCFVRGSSDDSEQEVAKVRALGEALGVAEGVVIYPEGTLFSPGKRQHVITSLRHRGDEVGAERAETLKNVLPPRPRGTVALLDAAHGADVVVCAHTGLERAASRANILGGRLIGATLRIRFQRFDQSSIPRDEAGRAEWLAERWLEIDRWISSADEPMGV